MNTIIEAGDIFSLGAMLFTLAWLGFWIDRRPIGKKTSGVVWVLLVSMLLSNSGIVPFKSPVYDFVGSILVPLAIPLLLLKANLKRIFTESGRLIVIFALASAATVAGAIIGYALFDLGEAGAKVAGTYTGGWIGGAVNFVAVSQAVEMTPQEFSEALGASAGVSVLALMLLIALPSIKLIKQLFPENDDTGDTTLLPEVTQQKAPHFHITHIAGVLALSFSICAISGVIVDWIDRPHFLILFVTLVTILVANLAPKATAKVEGDFELGMIIMYLFFAAVGAGTDALSFIRSASVLFFYALTIIIVHLIIILAVARISGTSLREAIIASAAALVGPAPTAAIAASKGWSELVTPGIMCGIFGYVIGTFVGVSVTQLLQ